MLPSFPAKGAEGAPLGLRAWPCLLEGVAAEEHWVQRNPPS